MTMNVEQILAEARGLSEAGRNDDARMLLLELLKEEPNNQTALLMLGGAYFCSDKFKEAEMIFERLVLLAPGVGQFSIALFNTLWKLDRHEEGLEEIRRFLAAADKDKERETIDQYIAITKRFADSDPNPEAQNPE